MPIDQAFPEDPHQPVPKGDRADGLLGSMPLGDHLEELRSRLIRALLGLVPIFVLALVFGRDLLSVLLEPIRKELAVAGGTFQVTGLFELFSAYIKLSLIISIVVGTPWVLYQAWRFIAPGLYSNEQRFVRIICFLSSVLSLLGCLFLYFVMLPVVVAFFVAFNNSLSPVGGAAPTPAVVEGALPIDIPAIDGDPAPPIPASDDRAQLWFNTGTSELKVRLPDGSVLASPFTHRAGPANSNSLIAQQYRVGETLSLILQLGLALVVAFQMPVVVLLLGWAGIVTPGFLRTYRRHAAMICAVLGALLTPADPVSMMFLAVPLYVLYEFGLLLLLLLPAERVAGKQSA